MMQSLALGNIDFGATDANAEYIWAKKHKSQPIFITAYVDPPLSYLDAFKRGDRFLLLGLKGTGKTAILRDLQKHAIDAGRITDFLIFRDEILVEGDLLDIPLIVDSKSIKDTKNYLHCVKRILISMLIKRCLEKSTIDELDDEGEDASFIRSFVEKIRSSSASQLIQTSIESIYSVVKSLNIDTNKLTSGHVSVDIGRLLKKQNELLLSKICTHIKSSGQKISLFVDEIHFAYRDEETLRQDAMLVRDTILAVINLNERFVKEEVDCVIYAAFRSEFLSHPLITAAETNNALSSFGETLSWATFPANKSHPMFDIVAKRVERSINVENHFPSQKVPFPKAKIFDTFLGGIEVNRFIEATWSKPRDIVRFFSEAKKMYPQKVSLGKIEFNAVLRAYAKEAWSEIKTAITAFLPEAGIIKLEEVLRVMGPETFEKGH